MGVYNPKVVFRRPKNKDKNRAYEILLGRIRHWGLRAGGWGSVVGGAGASQRIFRHFRRQLLRLWVLLLGVIHGRHNGLEDGGRGSSLLVGFHRGTIGWFI